MGEINNFELIRDNNFIRIKILATIDIDTLKEKLRSYLGQKSLKVLYNLLSDEGLIRGNQEIVIGIDNAILEQFIDNHFVYLYLEDKELFIDKIENSYFFLEDGTLYSSKQMSSLEKEKINSKIIGVLSYLKSAYNDPRHCNSLELLYHDMGIVNYDSVKSVTHDDTLELVLPNFYKINPLAMRMAIVLKRTKEVIGSIEFNFKLDQENFYDYKGNVSYEIKNEYQSLGYATKSLSLLRKYLREYKENNILYVATENDNVSSQKVALKNEGVLCYDGEVPKSSIINFLGKVEHVKIYRIENM